MELFQGLNTAERIAWGLLSFIALIIYLRWEGPRDDQKKDDHSQGAQEEEKHKAEMID